MTVNAKQTGAHILIILLACTSVLWFCLGFFPQRIALSSKATLDNLPPDPLGNVTIPESPFGKLIVMVVDALRSDFIFPDFENVGSKSNFPFVRQLFQTNQIFPFIAKAHTPTVTLPRLKALTSGGVPSFLDFLFNFNTQELVEDNIMYQLHQQGKRMRFFGDDTWLKLFPTYFEKFEGTTSFFATDTVEVDLNVTRNVPSQFTEQEFDNWDVLILHYLGLDHIGHSAGPNSPLMKPKQKEMDDVVRFIHENLLRMENSTAGKKPALFLLCSDHGMNDIGNHGGASTGESSSVMIFMSMAFSKSKIFKPKKAVGEVQQIDLAPTISLLYNSPIPRNSLGILIHDLFKNFPNADYLRYLQINAHQQLQILHATPMFWQNGKPADQEIEKLMSSYESAVQFHRDFLVYKAPAEFQYSSSLYLKFLRGLQQKFTASLSDHDMGAIYLGLVFLFITFLSSAAAAVPSLRFSEVLSGKWLFTCFALTCAWLGLRSLLCTSLSQTSPVCSSLYMPLYICSAALASFVFVGFFIGISRFLRPFFSLGWARQPALDIILLGSFLHIISLSSSSSVEEEHQTWYFLSTTLYLSICFGVDKPNKLPYVGLLFLSRVMRGWNQTGPSAGGRRRSKAVGRASGR
eukprot:TRINITY_DN3141_c0_g1_i1.p1 TRINITY_DN3141_c0_g1~~TRINITY_DN3141_c0_g1_i1.p1  ORF type:complete len:632 (+),score=53.61 TRINITY_DN3141_c0_g1_i1:66-1961(+)